MIACLETLACVIGIDIRRVEDAVALLKLRAKPFETWTRVLGGSGGSDGNCSTAR